MPVPDFQSLMLPILKALSGSAETPIAEVRARVADAEGLTADDLRELLSSGQSVFTNRTSWAVVHMVIAGLVERLRRGVYRLTTEGERLLLQPPPRIDLKVLLQYPSYVRWRTGKSTPSVNHNDAQTKQRVRPEEALERADQQLREALEADVLDRVCEAPPAFLEQVGRDLLIAMGYGGGDAKRGRVIGRSGDGGIDGTIRQDSLGLDEVYLQAKKYAVGNAVGESDLRNFAGRSMPQARARACSSPRPPSPRPPRTM